MVDAGVKVLFCGEEFPAAAGRALTIGRSGDVEIDDNPYLHRSFLVIVEEGGLWWLSNVGSTLTVTVADDKGLFHAWLSPGARIPLAFNRILVWFTAGPTTYDFEILVDNPAFASVAPDPAEQDHSGGMTVGRVSFTADQKLLIVALCESFLSRGYPRDRKLSHSATMSSFWSAVNDTRPTVIPPEWSCSAGSGATDAKAGLPTTRDCSTRGFRRGPGSPWRSTGSWSGSPPGRPPTTSRSSSTTRPSRRWHLTPPSRTTPAG